MNKRTASFIIFCLGSLLYIIDADNPEWIDELWFHKEFVFFMEVIAFVLFFISIKEMLEYLKLAHYPGVKDYIRIFEKWIYAIWTFLFIYRTYELIFGLKDKDLVLEAINVYIWHLMLSVHLTHQLELRIHKKIEIEEDPDILDSHLLNEDKAEK